MSAVPTEVAVEPVTAREASLRRELRLWRLGACCLISLLAGIGGTLGAASIGTSQQSNSGGGQAAAPDAQPRLVNVVLDPTRGSGRWNSTLLALDSQGRIWSLDTSRPVARWVPFQFSP